MNRYCLFELHQSENNSIVRLADTIHVEENKIHSHEHSIQDSLATRVAITLMGRKQLVGQSLENRH